MPTQKTLHQQKNYWDKEGGKEGVYGQWFSQT